MATKKITDGVWRRKKVGYETVWEMVGSAMWRADDDAPDQPVRYLAVIEQSEDGERRPWYQGHVYVTVGGEEIEVPLPYETRDQIRAYAQQGVEDAIRNGLQGSERGY